MASTIITKNNTTGTPGVSDLVQGELAINVSNGSLYYGAAGGTAVSQSFTFSDITASGTINTQNIYAGRFFQGTQAAGVNISTIYALKESPVFTGNITVAGNQAFNGEFIEGDGKEILRYSDAWLRINEDNDFSSGIYCGDGIFRTDGEFQVGGSGVDAKITPTVAFFAGNISASGNISGSSTSTLTMGGAATIGGSLRAKQIHMINTSFNDDMDTDEIFIPMNLTGESPNITNVNVPMVMPVAGKLLKLHFRANQHQNVSSNEITFKLYDVDTGENWNTTNSDVLGTKVITGLPKDDHTIADFTDLTTTGASGTNVFQAGDIIGVTMQHSADQNASNTSNYLVTFVFELDFNGY